MPDTLSMARTLVISLLLIALAAVTVGALTDHWWAHSDGDMTAATGLRSSEFCFPNRCETTWLGQGNHDERWVRAGVATYAASFLLAGLALLTAVAVGMRRNSDLLFKTTLVAACSTAISGLLFVWLAPELYPDMSAGYSMMAFFGGAVLIIGATGLALRGRPPTETS